MAMASASSCVRLDEVGGLLGVGQQLFAVVSVASVPMAVFLVALAGLQAAQAAQLAFDGDAQLVRHVDHLARHVDVVVVAGGVLPSAAASRPSSPS
jgi:hypothetical protein